MNPQRHMSHVCTHVHTHATCAAGACVCAYSEDMLVHVCAQLEAGKPLPAWVSSNFQTFWKLWEELVHVRTHAWGQHTHAHMLLEAPLQYYRACL